MIKLLGKKLGMSSQFNENGESVPYTLLEVGPCPIVQIKSVENDGYSAIQIGFAGDAKKKNMTKPVQNHIGKANVEAVRLLREFRVESTPEGYEVGKVLTLADLDDKKFVYISGTTKGRGFAGGVKRYGFRGGDASHGEEKHHRTNGSLSSAARLTHVWKGKRMSGHMGNVRHTIKNIEILHIDLEKNLLAVRGSVPGHSGAFVEVVQK